jgi:ABC-type multidrug transport system, ATPase and permease components
MKLMIRYVKKYKWLLLLNLFAATGFVIIELGLPTLLAQVMDVALPNNDFEAVKKYVFYMSILTIIGTVGRIAIAYIVTRVTANITYSLRQDIFRKTRDFSMTEINKLGVASMMTRTNNDPYQIMIFLQMALRLGFVAPLMFITSLIMCIRVSLTLSSTILIAVPLIAVGVVTMIHFSEPISKGQQKSLDNINQIMRESLTGLRVIRAFVRDKFQQNRFEQKNDEYTHLSKKMYYLMAIASPAGSLLFLLLIASVLWLGSQQVAMGAIKIGALSAFIDYLFHTLFSFMLVANIFGMYPKAAVSAGRITELLELEISVDPNINGIKSSPNAEGGTISFEQVDFEYSDGEGEKILSGITFSVAKGETVAFIGSTGSGKSTLIKLIPRFQDVISGRVLVNGIDTRDYNLAALRSQIGFVPQKAMLFTGTIRENLLLGDADATDEMLYQALEVAQAADFVHKLPDGLNHYLAEGGTNLSGGQKQRLAIARALVRKPQIYVFDDSFSALDYRTDMKLRSELPNYIDNATILIVAQRVGTIINADRIIVLDEGRIVAIGTHQELLKQSPVYYEIAASQLSKEELQ